MTRAANHSLTMNYAILRLQKRGLKQAGAMARHALRETSVAHADPARKSENMVLGSKTAADVMRAIEKRLPENRRSNAVPAIELFVGASPEAMTKMSKRDQDSYFKRALEWIGERFGGKQNIVMAAIHRDEATPHMQVLLVPLLDGKLNARKLVGNRGDMQQMQTEFAEQVGKPSGLRRGEKGSKAKHTSVRAFHGAIEAAGKREALPPRVPVPPPLERPGFFASKTEKAEYEKRESDRKKALAANKKRQDEIERLAALGLAAHSRARRAPAVLAAAEKAKAEAQQAKMATALVRQERDQVKAEIDKLKAQVPRLMQQRDNLANQVRDLGGQVDDDRDVER